jgi:hypothetical protein
MAAMQPLIGQIFDTRAPIRLGRLQDHSLGDFIYEPVGRGQNGRRAVRIKFSILHDLFQPRPRSDSRRGRHLHQSVLTPTLLSPTF